MYMQIVIPMSGFGERFRRAGYSVPKPLIKIEGKPIIAHVIDMFPGDHEFLFICNQDHLAESQFRMKEAIESACPGGRIIGIKPHKLGPIHAVKQVVDMLDMQQPVIVNYCDFTCYWDWEDFQKFVKMNGCVGAIPAYKGFHPHTLGSTNYAYLRETGGIVDDIQEKQPYTNNRMDEFASSGTYYFSSVKVMLDAFDQVVERNLNVGGEFYVSLAYKPLLEDGGLVTVYPLQHFMQWGTPEDVSEYNSWSKAFKKLVEPSISKTSSKGSFVVPMAGLGQRFADQGYEHTKPLIPVSGRSMVAQAANDLPDTAAQVFVLRSDMKGYEEVSEELRKYYPDCIIKTISCVTEGQAITAGIGLAALNELGETSGPITFGACDNGALYDIEKFNSLIDDGQTDVLVWCVRGYANASRKPGMFGWVDAAPDGLIKRISVKTPLDNPSIDPIVMGTFTFKKSKYFSDSLERLLERNGQINGEFYIDSLINDAIDLGYRCKIFEVDSYLCWGTPDDLKTFEYWQSCFHKWSSHPYRLELDARVSAEAVTILDRKYKAEKIFNNETCD
jgi:NDP-sugar pyrophosphorylase family protein